MGSSVEREELERLRESEARYRLLADSMSDLILQIDLAGTIRYVSPAVAVFGLEPAALVGRSTRDFIHPDDQAALSDRLQRAARDDALLRGADNEYRLRRGDGSWAWVQGNPALMRDADGQPCGIVTVVRDVTEQKALKARLVEREALYRQLADHATDIILHYDLQGVIQFASPSIGRFGYTPEQVVGRRSYDFCHPDDLDAMTQTIGGVIAGEDPPAGGWPPLRLRRADGGWAWCEGNPGAIRDAAGAVVGAVTILRDVSERRALEDEVRHRQAELADSELRYRLLADQSPDIIIRYDVTGRVEYISSAVRRYGRDPEALIGRNVAELLDPSEAERNDAWMADLTAGRPVPQGAANIWRSSDSGIYWEGRTTPLVENGQVIGAMSVIRDVTERVALEAEVRRKQAETEQALAQLAESEARHRAITDAAPDLIVRVDMKDVVAFASPSARRFGYSPQDMVGRRSRDFVYPEDWDGRVAAALRAGAPLPSGAQNRFRLVCKDGTLVWAEAHLSAIHDAAGEVVGIVNMVRDITGQVALEEELRRKRAEAEAAAVAKSQFLANMSHEIRTPLTAVVGFAGLMAKASDLPDQARVYLDRIAKSGEALTVIVNNVLDFSKIEAGEVELAPQPLDIAELAQDALAVVRDAAAAKGLSLTWAPEGALPARVDGDPGRLRQVLLNLLTNAVKFTRTGGVVLAASHSGGTLRFAVADTGVGVPAAQADRLFQRFSQIDGSNARAFGGTGLGLAISKGLVELMGGEIGYTPGPGGGSIFAFTVRAPAVAEMRPVAAEPEAPPLAQARVLVVDDAPLNRELILALLSPFDLETREAADGAEAVAAANDEPFDLILMDLQMPGMDGIAATAAIRAGGGPNRDTPIVAVSASVQPADVEACRRAGMNDHVPKPISAAELLAKVARWTAPSTHAAA